MLSHFSGVVIMMLALCTCRKCAWSVSPVSSAHTRSSGANFLAQSRCLSEQRDLIGAWYTILKLPDAYPAMSRQIASSRRAVLPLPVGDAKTRLSFVL